MGVPSVAAIAGSLMPVPVLTVARGPTSVSRPHSSTKVWPISRETPLAIDPAEADRAAVGAAWGASRGTVPSRAACARAASAASICLTFQ